MSNITKILILMVLVGFIIFLGRLFLFEMFAKIFFKYQKQSDKKNEEHRLKTLGESLKMHRTNCKMTQEFVAESLGVSRQAVSKWENGISDPSTSNLIALAKLYKVSVEDILKEVI